MGVMVGKFRGAPVVRRKFFKKVRCWVEVTPDVFLFRDSSACFLLF